MQEPMTFRDWFKEKFGRAPMHRDEAHKLSQRVSDLEFELRECSATLEENNLLELEYRAAKRAWNIPDKDKNP